MVVIGHSMGGILSRLMVSSSGDVLWKALQEYRSFTPEEMAEAEAEFGDMMRFEPFHGITRAVFIATPHRGTEFAEHRLARWASNPITLPATVLRRPRAPPKAARCPAANPTTSPMAWTA